MSLQLEKDANVSVQTHIDEFSSRFSILIVFWLLISLIWMLKVDLILEYIISILDPCDNNSCSNLYNPAKWSEVRWLSGALLGFVTLLPIIALQFYKFSRPGLMKNEAKGLRFWLIFCIIGFICNIIATIVFIMPGLFELGHQIQIELGFVPKYDIVAMLSMSIGLIWVEVLIVMGILTLLIANYTDNISERNLGWWKIRVHGIISMLIILSFYGQVSLTLFLLLISYLSIEIITYSWIKNPSKLQLESPIIFDQYGTARKFLFAQCECGTTDIFENYPFNNAYYSFSNLCENIDEQETLYQLINTNSFTDLIVFGCRKYEKLNKIEPNIFISKCNLRNDFSTHKMSNYTNSQQFLSNTDLRIASLIDPWNDEQSYQKIIEQLEKHVNCKPVILSNNDFFQFPEDIESNDLIIYTSNAVKKKLIKAFDNMNINYTIG